MKSKSKKVNFLKFDSASTRLLKANERSFQTGVSADCFPVVIEPLEGHSESLSDFFKKNSDKVKNTLHVNGAILFRGWGVATEHAFEKSVMSIKGITPLSEQLRVEPGRVIVPGTQHVYYTNTGAKTGGTFQLPGIFFHSENYYLPEVPAYQFFWAKKSSWIGGETGIIHMGHAYQNFPKGLQKRFEKEPVFTRSWPLFDLAQFHQIDEIKLEKILKQNGFKIQLSNGQKQVILFKPAVFRHPVTKRCSLQVNFKELGEVNQLIYESLIPYYSGTKWLAHRISWANDRIRRLLYSLDQAVFRISGQTDAPITKDPPSPIKFNSLRIGARVQKGEHNKIARESMKYLTVFPWQKGDILMIDNTQILHCGMPGFGSREIRVMMTNQILIPNPVEKGILEFNFNSKQKNTLKSSILNAKEKSSD